MNNINLSVSNDINLLVFLYLFTFFSIEAKAPVALQKQQVKIYWMYDSVFKRKIQI